MSTSAAPTVRCPACAATLRAGSDWCTLCYADLRPAPPPPAMAPPADESMPAPGRRVASSGGLATPADGPNVPLDAAALDSPVGAIETTGAAGPAASRPRGKHARRDQAYDETSKKPDEVEALANQLLAQLAASESKNPLGPMAGAVDSTVKRAILMVGGAVAAMLTIFIVMAILGALL